MLMNGRKLLGQKEQLLMYEKVRFRFSWASRKLSKKRTISGSTCRMLQVHGAHTQGLVGVLEHGELAEFLVWKPDVCTHTNDQLRPTLKLPQRSITRA